MLTQFTNHQTTPKLKHIIQNARHTRADDINKTAIELNKKVPYLFVNTKSAKMKRIYWTRYESKQTLNCIIPNKNLHAVIHTKQYK